MKRFSKKCLISFLMILILSNFIIGIPGIQLNTVYAADGGWNWDDILGGIVGILFWPLKLPFIVIPMGINTITSTLYQLGLVVGEGGTSPSGFFVTPYHILFNKMEIVNVNFFNLNSGHTTADAFRAAVASWYYTMRLIASMILLVILVYVGIRMAISTIASEKAMYKKMLVDWVTSLALLFLLHYIIQFVFACNEALVNGMDALATETTMDTFVEQLVSMSFGIDLIASVTGIAVYAMLVLQTLSFLIAYMKRMITVGFLIIIAPLITITYSMDKMGDGKAQALNNWLKEFIYNVLIQPFHCILYLAFGKIVLDLIASNGTSDIGLATAVLAILCIQFIKDGEKIVKKIFGFDQASSMGALSESAKMASAAMGAGTKAGIAAGAAVGKGAKALSKMPGKIGEAANKAAGKVSSAANAIKTSKVGQAVGKATEPARKAVKNTVSNAKNAIGRTMRDVKASADRKRAARKEDKIDKELEKRMRPNMSDEQKEALRSQISKEFDEKQEKRKQTISGFANTVEKGATTVGKGAAAVGRGAVTASKWAGKKFKMAGDKLANSKDAQRAIQIIAGISTGMIGMGDSFSTALNTGQFGSGFAEGLMSTSTRTAKNEIENQVGLQNNLGVDVDAQHMAMVKTKGDGDAFSDKELSNKIQQLLDKLNKLGVQNPRGAVENLNYGISFNPQSINRESIEGLLTEAGVSDEKKDEAIQAMMGFAQFRADAGLYKAMEAGNAVGMSMGDMLKTASKSNTTTERTTTHKTETYEEIHETREDTDGGADLESIADETKKAVENANRATEEAERAAEEAKKAAQEVESIDIEKMVRDNGYQ